MLYLSDVRQKPEQRQNKTGLYSTESTWIMLKIKSWPVNISIKLWKPNWNSLSSSSSFGICIWGDSIQRPPLETRKKDMLYFTCGDLELGLGEKARA